MSDRTCTLHATCIAVEGKGVLIIGPSGSGKSALALQLMAMGGQLVADDRTSMRIDEGRLYASAPSTIAGLIEARGVGILRVPYLEQARVSLIVDLEQIETTRLPPARTACVLDIKLPCLHKVDAPYFAAAIRAYMFCNQNEIS
ncbi:MAG: HPr kinase/phosphatase C-terminal domain-containing protein [Sulfitobacter sp.]